jgi:CRP-like cAMP-binding protein
MTFERMENLFSQGDREDSVFYLQRGRAKVSVVSYKGKEATITLVSVGDLSERRLEHPHMDCGRQLPPRWTPVTQSEKKGEFD